MASADRGDYKHVRILYVFVSARDDVDDDRIRTGAGGPRTRYGALYTPFVTSGRFL